MFKTTVKLLHATRYSPAKERLSAHLTGREQLDRMLAEVRHARLLLLLHAKDASTPDRLLAETEETLIEALADGVTWKLRCQYSRSLAEAASYIAHRRHSLSEHYWTATMKALNRAMVAQGRAHLYWEELCQ